MHISEGVLAAPVLLTGAGLAAIGTAIGLKRLDYDRVAQAGILSATFFVASLVHIPIGPSSVHLLLNGVVGLLLGWVAFPVILVGLTLQTVLFQFGGITVLGVNTINVAGPAVFCGLLLRRSLHARPVVAMGAAFLCGAMAVLLTALMVAVSLLFSEESFFEVASLVVVAHLPVMLIEGLVTAFCVAFLKKVQPDFLLAGFSGSSSRA